MQKLVGEYRETEPGITNTVLSIQRSRWADFDFLIMFVYAIHTIAVGFLKFCVFFCCCCCCCFKFTLVRKQTRMKICHLELGFHLFEFSGLCSVFFSDSRAHSMCSQKAVISLMRGNIYDFN